MHYLPAHTQNIDEDCKESVLKVTRALTTATALMVFILLIMQHSTMTTVAVLLFENSGSLKHVATTVHATMAAKKLNYRNANKQIITASYSSSSSSSSYK